MSNWADDILPEILDKICKRLIYFEDLRSFGGVCSTWRRVAIQQNNGKPLRRLLPWLMLAEDKNNKEGDRDFYSLVQKRIYSLKLPTLRGKKCIETKGWLVTSSKKGEMSLFHPITRKSIPLPPMQTFPYYEGFGTGHLEYVWRAVLSSNPNSSNDWVLMAIMGDGCHLGFCRVGEKEWSAITYRDGPWMAIEYYSGKFFAINIKGHIWGWEVMRPELIGNSYLLRDKIGRIPREVMAYKQTYLVECSGKLLIVTRGGITRQNYQDARYEFWVHELDAEDPTDPERMQQVTDLGTKAIFLGNSASLSVETSDYVGLCPNSIYFTDDCRAEYISDGCPKGGDKALGIFDLSNRTWAPHHDKESLSKVCPPIRTFLLIR